MTPPLFPRYIADVFPGYDPIPVDGSHFNDGQHRLVVHKTDDRKLYKTTDFVTFTEINSNWMSGVATNGGLNTFADCVVLADGTFVAYQNDDSEDSTAVWTGTATDFDNGTLTRQGQVLPSGGDCGAFYDASTGLIHIFTEDPTTPFGSVSSTTMTHYTTPDDDLVTASRHNDAFVTDGTWGTGDPSIFAFGGKFYMLADYTEKHPAYWTALLQSDDLHTWEMVDKQFSASVGVRGGDFDVVDIGDLLVAFTEYNNGQANRVGMWYLLKSPTPIDATPMTNSTSSRIIINGTRATIRVVA